MTELGHQSFQDALAAYALGALDEEEMSAFEQHLAGCARCREELASMRETVGSLALAAPPAAPPARLKDRVMAEVRGEPARQPARRPRRSGAPAWLRPGVALGAVAAAVAAVVVLATGGGTSVRAFAGIVPRRRASRLAAAGATVSPDLPGVAQACRCSPDPDPDAVCHHHRVGDAPAKPRRRAGGARHRGAEADREPRSYARADHCGSLDLSGV
jgi:anti-sigma factor RsiW